MLQTEGGFASIYDLTSERHGHIGLIVSQLIFSSKLIDGLIFTLYHDS
jgi:hypothetical protein